MKNKHIRLGDEKGITLIEIMLCFGLLAMVVGGGISVLNAAHHMSVESRNRLLALNAARSTLEAIKETTLPGVTAINTAPFIPADLQNGAIVITTNPNPILAATQIATVTVTVSWRGNGNRLLNLQITTLKSRFV